MTSTDFDRWLIKCVFIQKYNTIFPLQGTELLLHLIYWSPISILQEPEGGDEEVTALLFQPCLPTWYTNYSQLNFQHKFKNNAMQYNIFGKNNTKQAKLPSWGNLPICAIQHTCNSGALLVVTVLNYELSVLTMIIQVYWLHKIQTFEPSEILFSF